MKNEFLETIFLGTIDKLQPNVSRVSVHDGQIVRR